MPHPLETIEQRYARTQRLHVGILVFPEVEVLDFAGPFEVFSVASRIHPQQPFTVSIIGAAKEPILARHGLGVVPHLDYAQAIELDLLIVPGGIVTHIINDEPTLAWIRRSGERAALVGSVCTGAFLLAKLGMLANLPCTTHWDDMDLLRSCFPQLDIRENVKFVDNGRIVTSAGISAGIEMSLHLVGRILGQDAAVATARQMEYDWP